MEILNPLKTTNTIKTKPVLSLYKPKTLLGSTTKAKTKPLVQDNSKLTLTLTKPKYDNSELEELKPSDTDYYNKLQYKYSLDDDTINLYKTRYDVNDYIGAGYNIAKFQQELRKKYVDTPNVNILSYGGDYKKYDDLINNILENGNVDGKYNNKINEYSKDLLNVELQNKTLEGVFKYIGKAIQGEAGVKKVNAEYAAFLEALKNYDNASGIERVTKSMENIGLSFIGSPIYAAEMAGQGIKNIFSGTNETVDESSIGSQLLSQGQKAQQQATAGLTGSQSFLWNTGTSIVNNLLNYAVFGGFAPLNMGVQAGSQAALGATQKGGTYTQALAQGTAQGVAEGLFEKISLGNLKALKAMPSRSVKTFIKNSMIQAGVEFSEESATEVANILTDMAIMGSKSDMEQYFNDYVAKNPNATNKEAIFSTVGVALKQVGQAGLAGAISGVVMGGGSQALGLATKEGRAAGGTQATRDYALTASKQLAKTGSVSKATAKSLKESIAFVDKQYGVTDKAEVKEYTGKDIDKIIADTVKVGEFAKTEEQTIAIKESIASGINTLESIKAMNTFIGSKKVKSNYYYDKIDNINGYYKNGVINVNLASDEGAYYTAIHEYKHYLEKNSPKMLNDYLNHVDTLIETSPEFKKIADNITALYKKDSKTKGIKPADLRNEIAFKISKELVDNPTKFNKIVTNNTTVAERLLIWFKNLSNRLRGTSLKTEEKAVREAVKALQSALKGTVAKKTTVDGKDTKYSITEKSSTVDSKGKALTKEQQDFFKDSKVRDEQGRLLEVYHGSPSEFNIFNYNKIGSQGTQEGFGFYFTDKQDIATGYSLKRAKGRLYKTYLNIAKPLSADTKVITKNQLRKFIDKYSKFQIKDEGDAYYLSNYGDVNYDGYAKILEMAVESEYSNSDNDVDLISGIINAAGGRYDDIYKILNETLGYDGIISKWINEGEKTNIYIVFSPNQIKLTTNLNPTENEDIRYSLSDSAYPDGIIKTIRTSNIKLTDKLYSEIKSSFDKGGAFGVISKLRLAKKNTTPIDTAYQELSEEHPYLFPKDITSEIDQVLKLLDIIDSVENEQDANELFSEEEQNEYPDEWIESFEFYDENIEQRAEEILPTPKEEKTHMTGKESNKAVRESAKKQFAYNKLGNRIVDNAKTLRDYRKGEYINASFLADPRLEQYAKLLAPMQYRGNLVKNPQSLRKAIVKLDAFYNRDILNDTETNVEYYSEQIRNDIDLIVDRYNKLESGKKKSYKLTFNEMQAIERITNHIKHLYTTYNTVDWKGKKRETIKTNAEALKKLEGIKKVNEVIIKARYLLNPADMFAITERHTNGILSEITDELQLGKERQTSFQRKAITEIKKLFEDNPKYEKTLREMQKNGLSKGQALGLYLTYERPQGRAYLDKTGVEIKVANNKQEQKGNFSEAEKQSKNIPFKVSLLPTLTDTDKQFVKILRKLFAWSGKEISAVEDKKYGIHTPKENKYYPLSISGDETYSVLGRSRKDDQIFRKPSFENKLTKVGTKGKDLYIGNVLDVVYGHINAASAYVGFSVLINDINKIYNTKVNGINIKERVGQINREFKDYLNTYLQDVQGIRGSMDSMDRVLAKLRSWAAVGALGLNPKVWFNQLTSIPMAKSVGVSYTSQEKGINKTRKLLTSKGEYAEEYNKLIDLMPEVWQRYKGSIAIKEAMGMQSKNKFDKGMEVVTSPIQKSDKFAIMSLWQACKIQNDNNIEKSVAMMKEVIRKTQPNYEAINRSQIARSRNQMTKMLTMYMTQPLQNFSRMFTAVDRYIAAKESKDTNAMKSATANLKATTSAFVFQGTAYVLVAQVFKALLGTVRRDRNREEIPITTDILRDMGGVMFGMFPVVRDIYTYFSAGYEPTNVAYSGLSNLLNAATSLFKATEMLFDGDASSTQAINRAYRNVILGLTQTFGIPFRNVERYTTGIIGRFNPEFAIKYNSLFYEQQYTTLLKKSIAKNDTEQSIAIIDNMMKYKGISGTTNTTNSEILRLYKLNYNAVPQKLGLTVTHDTTVYQLTKSQETAFKNIYGQSSQVVTKLINTSSYKALSDEAKAKAIKNVYSMYYSKAKGSILNLTDSEIEIIKTVDIAKYSQVKAFYSTAETDKDSLGNPINGSKKSKVLSYINSVGLSASQKTIIIESLGYKDSSTPQTTKKGWLG